MPDHIHILSDFGLHNHCQILCRILKAALPSGSTKRFIKGKFSWQEGYGAFSYSKSALPNLIQYIKNQEDHHKKRSFIEEYEDLLKEFEIDYNERFVLKPVDYIVPDGTS